jgi:SAM-dependent methyltransferase
MKLQERVQELYSKGVFLGGGKPDQFEQYGRLQLMVLLREGLRPQSKVLDIGCGALRGGYWLIHFLNPGCYCGIEPNTRMLETGLESFFESGVLETKRPRFDANKRFDTSVFGESFDFFIARSVWTHAAKRHIQAMLDGFVHDSTDDAAFLTSYCKTTFKKRDYTGGEWVGRSHESDSPGIVFHKLSWIRNQCRPRGLKVTEIKDNGVNYGNQTWLRVTKNCSQI